MRYILLHVHTCLWFPNIGTNLFSANLKWMSNKSAACVQFIDPCQQCTDICPVLLTQSILRTFTMTSAQSPFLGITSDSYQSTHTSVCAALHLPASKLHVSADSLHHWRFVFPRFHIKIQDQICLISEFVCYEGSCECVWRQLPILDASPQHCHLCRGCHDDSGGRPVSLPQFFSGVSDDYL